MVADPHSYWDASQPVVTHLDWAVAVDFSRRVLDCTAVLSIEGAGVLDLDTRNLDIASVTALPEAVPVPYEMGTVDAVLGQRLRLVVPPGTLALRIVYATRPESTALQWLEPAQTADGTHSFVYSQCQTIHARSMVPVPDSPSARITVHATFDVPEGYTAVMAGTPGQISHGGRRFSYDVTQSIPAYLLAFAVGALVSERIGPRSLVWAEPSMLASAAWEFAEVETILQAAESVMGDFPWQRADLIVMPPSYPYGGMENPQLIYLTPTLVTGDRSLVNVLSHEVIHHWTGDMVTCASLEHFWLNEGFTVFGERKVTELLEGREVAELQAAIGRDALDDDLRYLQDTPELTSLRLHLEGVHPDVSSSWVALEKGNLFLRAIEESVGEQRFAAFLRDYLDRFRFRSLTGEEFVAFAEAELPGAVDYEEWLHGTGLPDGTPVSRSRLLDRIRSLGNTLPEAALAGSWGATEWQVYLGQLQSPVDTDLLSALDDAYSLTASRNSDVLAIWLHLGLLSGYGPAVPASVGLLATVGRLKYLKVLYHALADRPDTHQLALDTFAAHRHRYHPIAVTVVSARLHPA
ncbi:M1 family metallopeptidase [Acidothermaceae bacterium B102]|nr:M1 family metallopeptidase [Acidothermaceae bacterium B102]